MRPINEIILDFELSEGSELGADLEQDGTILIEALGHCPCSGCRTSSGMGGGCK